MPQQPSEIFTIVADSSARGARVDRFLADSLPDLTRARVQKLIASGHVMVGAATLAEPSQRVKPGETFTVSVPPAAEPEPSAQAIPLVVVHEDDAVIVIDKPAGLVVHPAAGNPDRTLVNALIAHCGDSLSGIGGVRRPGIVHRLDKDTSGLMVAAKTDAAHQHLAAQFAAHSLERAYQALVWGVPRPAQGEIAGAIGRHPRQRKKMAVVARGGKAALTRYRVVRRFGDLASLVECRLATGRTHQIRVHLSHSGWPLVGDPVYGRSRRGLPTVLNAGIKQLGRQALHAFILGFEHPTTGRRLKFQSQLPNDINDLVQILEQLK